MRYKLTITRSDGTVRKETKWSDQHEAFEDSRRSNFSGYSLDFGLATRKDCIHAWSAMDFTNGETHLIEEVEN